MAGRLAAQVPGGTASRPDSQEDKAWSFSVTVTGTRVSDSQAFASSTFLADGKRLHLEARYNYENQRTGSVWTGYNLEFGHKVEMTFTPMVGGVFGRTNGIAPGYRFSATWTLTARAWPESSMGSTIAFAARPAGC